MIDSSVRKAVAVAVVAAVATMSGGCGSGDDDDANEGASAATTAQQSEGRAASYPVGKNDAETVRKLVEDVYDGTAAADPSVCGNMTKAAQRQMVTQGTQYGFKPLPCPQMVKALFGPVKSVNSKREPDIVSVKVNGRTAVAKLKRRNILPLPYTAVKVDAEWKLADLGKEPIKSPKEGEN